MQITKQFKYVLISVIVFFLLFIGSNVSAQIPPPNPTPIPCSSTGNPEFNSLRPYQASPCSSALAPSAKFCANNLTLHDVITVTYPGGGDCSESGNKIVCEYKEDISKVVTIDISGANLPVMGNTEDGVKNSQDNSDSMSNAEKVNSYVSWYLHGVINKAEDGTSNTTEEDIINYSGPLNKLLPGAILDARRATSIKNAGSTNHNQIVVCGDSNIPVIGNFLRIGTINPKDCYAGDGTDAKGQVFRLESWDGNLSLFNSATNFVTSAVDAIAEIMPEMTRSAIERYVVNAWNKRTPPLPWSDENGRPFKTEDLYMKAYNEWRGKTCIIVPVVGKTVCFENIAVPNKYAELYSYVPLASTEDLKGNISVDQVSSATSPSGGNVVITNTLFSNQVPATLFYPHMQESDQLASALQDTFVSKDNLGEKAGAPDENIACDDVPVISAKGDNLFAKQITGTVSYHVEFTCSFDTTKTTNQNCLNNCLAQGNTPSECSGACTTTSTPSSSETCVKDVYITLSTTSSSPQADSVWSRLVAGPQAIFKRIFPKTNTEGSVGRLIDIPGTTDISYTGATSDKATLNLPHLGGVSEYFLRGIQTALRPKGYGSKLTFAPNSGEESGEINCDESVPEIAVSGLNKAEGTRVSSDWYGKGVGKAYFEECNNDVIKRAQGRGVDPIFTLAIWIHESGASNYEATTPVEDWGIHGKSDVPTNNFSLQLNFFLNLPDSYAARCGKKDMKTFISMFWFGHCTPANEEAAEIDLYISELNFIYDVIAPTKNLPTYPK